MKRLSVLVLAAAAFAAVPVASSSVVQARPLCVQYNDPIHMGSYQVCPLGGSGTNATTNATTNEAAPPVPTTVCGVERVLGVNYVKDCEGGPVS